MDRTLPDIRRLHSAARILVALPVFFCVCFCAATYSKAADTAIQVQLDTKEAKPRAVENLTERGILRDYRFAWKSMAQALESNSINPLEGPFAGNAKEWLRDTILSQQHSGLSRRYDGQTHRLEAVFYAPEGDVMELHDTAEYQLQLLDGGKVVSDEHIVQHFVVLMTPGADHWVIRQLQAVPQF
jgi:hypothetical protein